MKQEKTYFVCSDIHGYFDEWMSSLKEAGFDLSNKDHILIVLGDIFDRGRQPKEIYDFLCSFPKNRLILIRGNHEYLLLDLIKRGYPLEHDGHNGTYQTLKDFWKDPFEVQKQFILENKDKYPNVELIPLSKKAFQDAMKELYNNDIIKSVVSWIKSSKWRNYYELGQYIFVHAFIPLGQRLNPYSDTFGSYYERWREEEDPKMWEDSTWGCPYKLYLSGCFDEELKKGKILVCGHWHTSLFYNELLYKNDKDKQLDIKKDNPIFKSPLYPGLIGLDACTALTRKVNVLVIKEEELLHN